MAIWKRFIPLARRDARSRCCRSTKRLNQFEQMEARLLLASDALHVGAVYIEQDLGSDLQGDVFEITFVGGADGTLLTRAVIDGDQNELGISVADAIFDTQLGGLGGDEGIELRILSQTGIDDVRWFVDDGTSQLILEFVGFDPGDKLVFSIDVDEVQDYEDGMSVAEINEGVDPITSGIEFQGSQLIAEFSAEHYFDSTATAEFRNRYDANFHGRGLDLPADNANGQRDRTAGAAGELVQEPIPAQLSGYVYHDRDDDGLRESGEEGLADVPVRIVPVDTVEPQTVITVTTDDHGFYQADGLMPGTYRLVEVAQPAGYLDGIDSVGTVDGTPVGVVANPGDEMSQIDLKGGQAGIDYNFGEVLPALIEGRVQLSTPDGDCFGDSVQHRPVAGVTIELLDSAGNVIATTSTDADGRYSFGDLRPGSYGIHEVQPNGLIDGGVNPGKNDGQVAGEIAAKDTVTSIDLLSGQAATDVSFCEHEPVTLSGHVYHDRDNDGHREAGEEGIAGVTILLRDENGSVTETTTDENGRYQFEGLLAGQYMITEVHPTDWVDGIDTAGTVAGAVVGTATNPGDQIDGVFLQWGEQGEEYNFGELQTATISGRVQLSTREGDCFGDAANHEPVAGAVVQLIDQDGARVAETTTNANGEYQFANLIPGNYSLVELTPAGLVDGSANVGHVNGETRGQIVDGGTIRDIMLHSGELAQQFDFCEHEPAQIGGYVYHDRDNDGVRDPGEEPIENVELILYDEAGNIVARAFTDENGHYQFEGLPPGIYSIEEIHPDGYFDGQDSPGLVNGSPAGVADQPGDRIRQIELGWGDEGNDFNFGELKPATLRGIVHTDVGVRDCDFNPQDGDELLADVRLQLLAADGTVIAETETDALGRYEFANLEPGAYSIREIQPTGYFDGNESAPEGKGDTSGVNIITGISVGSGENVEELNFCEDPPAVLSGYVFQDGENIVLNPNEELPERIGDLRDGRRSADDKFLSNVLVELRDGLTGLPISHDFVLPGMYPEGPIVTLTDENGFYEFGGLLAGQYSVYEYHPEGFIDGVDTPGTSQGFVFNPGEPTNEAVLLGLKADPLNDAIVRIGLRPGTASFENNFSEIQVVRRNPAVLPPPPPLPPPPIEPPGPPPVVDIPIFEIPSLPDFEIKGFGQMSTDVAGYTWHLSVVDAGQPRGDGLAVSELALEEPVWFAATYLPVNNATGYFSQGQWVFERGADGKPVRNTTFFGIAGARPVVGDFNGDGVFEVAVFHNGEWFIDINGNGIWDTNDLWAKLGRHKRADLPVAGDWDGDGKDDIGIFGPTWPGDPRAIALEPGLPDDDNPPTGSKKNIPPRLDEATIGNRVMKLTNQGPLRADVIDHVFHYGIDGDLPVVGDWNGDGIQSIGVFRDGRWHLDVDGNGRWTEDDEVAYYGVRGDMPVVGDFNGDGIDEIGFFRNGKFYLDTNGNRKLDDTDRVVELGRAGDFPVAGDFDGDGVDEVAVYREMENPAESVARKAG